MLFELLFSLNTIFKVFAFITLNNFFLLQFTLNLAALYIYLCRRISLTQKCTAHVFSMGM